MTIISPAPGPGTSDSAGKINYHTKPKVEHKTTTVDQSSLTENCHDNSMAIDPGQGSHMITSGNCKALWSGMHGRQYRLVAESEIMVVKCADEKLFI